MAKLIHQNECLTFQLKTMETEKLFYEKNSE